MSNWLRPDAATSPVLGRTKPKLCDPAVAEVDLAGHPPHTARSHSRTETRQTWQTRPRPTSSRPPGSKNRHPATRHDVGKAAIKKTTQEPTPSPGG